MLTFTTWFVRVVIWILAFFVFLALAGSFIGWFVDEPGFEPINAILILVLGGLLSGDRWIARKQSLNTSAPLSTPLTEESTKRILDANQSDLEIQRKINLRKRLRDELITNDEHLYTIGYHPDLKYQFRSIIIHSIDDETYGTDGDFPPNESEYSGWFKVEIWDLYHDGVEVIVGIDYGLLGSNKKWTIVDHSQSRHEDGYCAIKMYRLGRIPLGLSVIQPLRNNATVCEPIGVEVLSPKFPDIGHHVAFLAAFLQDLFTRATRLPFSLSEDTLHIRPAARRIL